MTFENCSLFMYTILRLFTVVLNQPYIFYKYCTILFGFRHKYRTRILHFVIHIVVGPSLLWVVTSSTGESHHVNVHMKRGNVRIRIQEKTK